MNQPFAYLAQNADRVIIGRVLGAATLGLYTRASFFASHGSDSVRKYRAPLPLSGDGQGAGRRGEASERALEVFLRARAADATCQRILRHLRTRNSSIFCSGASGSAAVVPFAILSGTLYFSLAWRNCATLFQALGHPYWITAVLHLPSGSAHCRYLVGSAPWTYGNLRSDRGRDGLDACDHAHHRQDTRSTFRFDASAAAHVHPLVITAAASGLCLTVKALLPELPGPALVLLTLLFSYRHFPSSSFSTRSASSAQPASWRSTDS